MLFFKPRSQTVQGARSLGTAGPLVPERAWSSLKGRTPSFNLCILECLLMVDFIATRKNCPDAQKLSGWQCRHDHVFFWLWIVFFRGGRMAHICWCQRWWLLVPSGSKHHNTTLFYGTNLYVHIHSCRDFQSLGRCSKRQTASGWKAAQPFGR